MIALPLPYRLAAVAILSVVALASGFVLGYTRNAGTLLECRATIDDIKETSYALQRENARISANANQVQRDMAHGWSAALDYLRAHPVRMRVRSDRCPATAAPSCATAGGIEEAASELGFGSGRSQAAEISHEELDALIQRARQDATQVLWMLEHDERQAEVAP